MNRMKSPHFCANGCISELNNGPCEDYFSSSSSEYSLDDSDRKILIDVTIENDERVDSRCPAPCTSKSIRDQNVVPERSSSNKFMPKNIYGSEDKDAVSSENSKHRVIYCIHGKPEGCCATVISETDGSIISDSSINKPPILFDNHCHQNRETKVDKDARKKLIIASILCLIFMIAEVVGGVMSSSLAIATDAAHLLTDFASFMISLFALWVGSRPATRSMPFGWYRAEVIGALTSVLMIWVVTGILFYMAVERILSGDYEIDSKFMLITSLFGLIVNITMACALHQHGHHHHHGHSHDHDHGSANGELGEKVRRDQNLNVRAAYIHVIGDFIQSFGVLVASIIIYFKPEWKIVDPICTFLFSFLVLMTTFTILRDTVVVLMEGIPKGIDYGDVLSTFLSIEGVVKVHNLRIWALSLDKTALAAHLAVQPGSNTSGILRSASHKIHSKFNFFEMTLQIEDFQQQMDVCKQCQDPIS